MYNNSLIITELVLGTVGDYTLSTLTIEECAFQRRWKVGPPLRVLFNCETDRNYTVFYARMWKAHHPALRIRQSRIGIVGRYTHSTLRSWVY